MDTLLLPAMECSSGASCLGSRCHTGLSQAVSCKPSFYAYVAGKGNYFHHCSAHLSLRQAPNSSFIPQAAVGGCSAQFSSIWGSQVPSKATVPSLKAPTSNCRKILEIRAAQPATQSTILRSMDTAGAVMVVEDVTLSTGGRDLLTGASWRLLPGQRTGLVGVNGCGKSTLLRGLVGQADIQSGYVALSSDTEVAYLEQTAVSGSTRTVWDEARSRMVAVNRALEELEASEKAVERAEDGAIARLAKAQEQVEATDGYRVDETIAGVLNGLGFQQADWTRSCMDFSGGWQMRIALARLLLEQRSQTGKSLLLLDEPTNHLDVKAKEWLGKYLQGVTAAVVLVSHEQDFLEKACNHIAEIQGGELHHYVGNYSSFLRSRAARQLQASQAYKAKQAEIERLQVFVDRFGAKATKASAANSRKKMIEKIKQQMPDVAPTEEMGESAGDMRSVKMRLPRPPPCAREVLIMRKVKVGWNGSAPLLHNVDLRIETGMRLVILGPNGCGKSTLMGAMASGGGVLEGIRDVGEGVEIGVFTQDLAQDLPTHLSGLEFVLQVARERDASITDEMARSSLGALGLTGDAALRPIKALSGGEKARVALGVFMLRPYNCLMLDEASNHLDRQSAMALAKSLSQFKGAMVAISHDHQFCQAIDPTHVARVGPDGSVTVSLCIGGDLGVSKVAQGTTNGVSKGKKKTVPASIVKPGAQNGSTMPRAYGGASHTKPAVAPDMKRMQHIQTLINKNMQLIEKAETVLAMLDIEMMESGSDAGKALEILKRKQAIEKRKSDLEREWGSLEEESVKLLAKAAK